MFEQFTDRARKIMQLANQEAQRFNHEYIGTEHVFLGLIKEGNGVAANVLKNLNVDLRKARLGVEALVQSGPEMITIGKLPQTPRCKKVIQYAHEERQNLGHSFLGSEHLLLGLLREQEGVAAQVLMNLELKLASVRREVMNLLGVVDDDPVNDSAKTVGNVTKIPRVVERYSVNLVNQHETFPRHIPLDSTIVRRMLISLTRTTTSNIFLVGDLYTCEEYVRHIASLIATKQIPSPLATHSIYELGNEARAMQFDSVCLNAAKFGNIILAADLFSGTKYADRRLVEMLDEGRYWFGCPSVSFVVSGPMSKWNEIQTQWPRVADSFSMIELPEPGREAVHAIVEFERAHLQIQHGVRIKAEAVGAAIQNASEIQSNGHNPVFVRAIEIIDYAAARARLFDSPSLVPEQQSKHDELVEWFTRMHLARKDGNDDVARKLNEKIQVAQAEFLKGEASRSLPVIGKSEIEFAASEMNL